MKPWIRPGYDNNLGWREVPRRMKDRYYYSMILLAVVIEVYVWIHV